MCVLPVQLDHLPNDGTALAPLLTDIGRLKRVRGREGESVAALRFRAAWSALAFGTPLEEVAATELAAAAAHIALGAVDAAALAEAGVALADRRLIYERAAAKALDPMEPRLSAALHRLADATDAPEPPPFAADLAAETLVPPRRLPPVAITEFDPFDPPPAAPPPAEETLGEHSWTVAVLGALLSRARGEPLGDPFLLGLSHHLGADALDQLPDPLAKRCRSVAAQNTSPDTPVGAAFAAAHVIDRVLQQRYHANDAGLSLSDAGAAEELVGHGPLSPFDVEVLNRMGLAF